MTLNALPAVPATRQPRGIVKIGGVAIVGWLDWEVQNNAYHSADTFRVTYSVSALPTTYGAVWFAAQTEAFVEIFAGFPKDPTTYSDADLQSLIYGRIDHIEFNPVANSITLTGRDLTAAFIDAKLGAQYQGLTASQIATTLATSHGLSAIVTATTALAGTMYARDHVQMTDERSEWDLLAWLADEEGRVCYVQGHVLYFVARPVAPPEPYQIQWQISPGGLVSANVQELTLSRALQVAKGVTVLVRSWNAKMGKLIIAYYPSKPKAIAAGQAGPFGAQQVYKITRGGLDQATANKLAQKTQYEITQHEMRLTARLPGDNLLTQSAIVRMTGTGTNFDQDYYLDSVTRQMSLDEGYTMQISAKNHNVDTVSLTT